MATATEDFRMINSAMSITAASSCVSSTALLMSPIDAAVVASINSPVNNSSAAFFLGTFLETATAGVEQKSP